MRLTRRDLLLKMGLGAAALVLPLPALAEETQWDEDAWWESYRARLLPLDKEPEIDEPAEWQPLAPQPYWVYRVITTDSTNTSAPYSRHTPVFLATDNE